MCGIVGLFLKEPALAPQLGAMLAAMAETMSDRGPDSAGFAVYGSPEPGRTRLTLRAASGYDWDALAARLGGEVRIAPHGTHVVASMPNEDEAAVRACLPPGVSIVGAGARMALFKDVGRPADVAAGFGIDRMAGTHGIAHTRMATESAVTTNGAHPFTTGPDQCLVHNGSLSNHNGLRRRLQREGMRFETENDSEVAAGYLTWRMGRGEALGQALGGALRDLDGFYTFVVGTEHGFGVLRDPIACKPAVLAETERWVAFGSEYRALADLPGVQQARVWEPEPATVYAWERPADALH